jgi:uncharacterized protein
MLLNYTYKDGSMMAVKARLLLAIGIMCAAYALSHAQNNVVISQIYGSGGNTGATYKNDFIEIFNLQNVTVDISTWSVQYRTAGGTSWSKTNLAGILQPGQYHLIQLAQGAIGDGAALPTPYTTGTTNLNGPSGVAALVAHQTTLTDLTGAPCVRPPQIEDYVGYGAFSITLCFEGSGQAPAGNATAAVIRNSNGCDDTDDNAIDFSAGTPTPRNAASPTQQCGPAFRRNKTQLISE